MHAFISTRVCQSYQSKLADHACMHAFMSMPNLSIETSTSAQGHTSGISALPFLACSCWLDLTWLVLTCSCLHVLAYWLDITCLVLPARSLLHLFFCRLHHDLFLYSTQYQIWDASRHIQLWHTLWSINIQCIYLVEFRCSCSWDCQGYFIDLVCWFCCECLQLIHCRETVFM